VNPEARLELVRRLARAPEDGSLKLYVTQRSLTARRADRAVFERGNYLPVTVTGQEAERVVAFSRSFGGKSYLVAAGRLLVALGSQENPPLGAAWGDSCLVLPSGLGQASFRDAFTGEVSPAGPGGLPLAAAFAHLPIALLESIR
jgi:(1->4)-alpha-D-glucan 1-alpha-D-glucosylmutase